MPGVAQVWLTAEELEAVTYALDVYARQTSDTLRAFRSAQVKVEYALGTITCSTSPGAK